MTPVTRNYKKVPMVKTKDIHTLITDMAKLDMCPEGESAQTFFGARDPCHFHPPNDTLEDLVRQIILYYGLQEFIPLPGEGSYFVHFTDDCRSPNYANTISTGSPGQGNFALEYIEVTDEFLDWDNNAGIYQFLVGVLLHELVHILGMLIPLSHDDNGQHAEAFQRLRIKLEYITGMDISPH